MITHSHWSYPSFSLSSNPSFSHLVSFLSHFDPIPPYHALVSCLILTLWSHPSFSLGLIPLSPFGLIPHSHTCSHSSLTLWSYPSFSLSSNPSFSHFGLIPLTFWSHSSLWRFGLMPHSHTLVSSFILTWSHPSLTLWSYPSFSFSSNPSQARSQTFLCVGGSNLSNFGTFYDYGWIILRSRWIWPFFFFFFFFFFFWGEGFRWTPWPTHPWLGACLILTLGLIPLSLFGPIPHSRFHLIPHSHTWSHPSLTLWSYPSFSLSSNPSFSHLLSFLSHSLVSSLILTLWSHPSFSHFGFIPLTFWCHSSLWRFGLMPHSHTLVTSFILTWSHPSLTLWSYPSYPSFSHLVSFLSHSLVLSLILTLI